MKIGTMLRTGRDPLYELVYLGDSIAAYYTRPDGSVQFSGLFYHIQVNAVGICVLKNSELRGGISVDKSLLNGKFPTGTSIDLRGDEDRRYFEIMMAL